MAVISTEYLIISILFIAIIGLFFNLEITELDKLNKFSEKIRGEKELEKCRNLIRVITINGGQFSGECNTSEVKDEHYRKREYRN